MPQLDAIGITSRDLGASVRFYRLLGVPFDETAEDHLEATLPNGMRLMLDSVELATRLDPEWIEPTGHRMSLAFRCATPAEVDATHARVTAAGHPSKAAPWNAFWGQRYAQVVDPDGNVVDLFAPLT